MNILQLTGQTDNHITYFGDNANVGIHTDMMADFLAMQNAAKADGINLSIASGFRSFDRQLSIWNRKCLGELAVKNLAGDLVEISELSKLELIHAIMLFSALPGASRHHWGCDIDVYDQQALGSNTLALEPWEYTENGPFHQLSLWLAEQSKAFGFYFPYQTYNGGVAAEPWHLSYAPLASEFEQTFTLAMLEQTLEQSNIMAKQTILAHLPQLFNRFVTNVGKANHG